MVGGGSQVGEGGPYGINGVGDSESLAGSAAKARCAALEEAVAEKFREVLRKSWNSPSMRAILTSVPNLMLPGAADFGIEATARNALFDFLRGKALHALGTRLPAKREF